MIEEYAMHWKIGLGYITRFKKDGMQRIKCSIEDDQVLSYILDSLPALKRDLHRRRSFKVIPGLINAGIDHLLKTGQIVAFFKFGNETGRPTSILEINPRYKPKTAAEKTAEQMTIIINKPSTDLTTTKE